MERLLLVSYLNVCVRNKSLTLKGGRLYGQELGDLVVVKTSSGFQGVYCTALHHCTQCHMCQIGL